MQCSSFVFTGRIRHLHGEDSRDTAEQLHLDGSCVPDSARTVQAPGCATTALIIPVCSV